MKTQDLKYISLKAQTEAKVIKPLCVLPNFPATMSCKMGTLSDLVIPVGQHL